MTEHDGLWSFYNIKKYTEIFTEITKLIAILAWRRKKTFFVINCYLR